MLFAGFLIGFLGSLHCLGMCSPIAMVMHTKGKGPRPLLYNIGRTLTYAILGACLGLIGEGAGAFGAQSYVSMAMGVLVIMLAFQPRLKSKLYGSRLYAGLLTPLRNRVMESYGNQSISAYFLTGMLNGILPCGLVYMAITAAIATGGVINSTYVMIGFGLGTWPMMFAVGTAGKYLTNIISGKLRMAIPVVALVLGTILIARGLSVDMPFMGGDSSGITVCE